RGTDTRAGVSWCPLARNRARPGRELGPQPADQYRDEPRSGLGHSHERGADDRAAHAGARRHHLRGTHSVPRSVSAGVDRMPTGLKDLLRHTRATAIVGDLLKVRAHDIGLGDMAVVETPDGTQSLAQAIQLDGDEVSLQVFAGGKGLSTQAT